MYTDIENPQLHIHVGQVLGPIQDIYDNIGVNVGVYSVLVPGDGQDAAVTIYPAVLGLRSS